MIYRIVGLTGTLKHTGLVSHRGTDTVLVKLVQLYIAYRLTHQYNTPHELPHAPTHDQLDQTLWFVAGFWQGVQTLIKQYFQSQWKQGIKSESCNQVEWDIAIGHNDFKTFQSEKQLFNHKCLFVCPSAKPLHPFIVRLLSFSACFLSFMNWHNSCHTILKQRTNKF